MAPTFLQIATVALSIIALGVSLLSAYYTWRAQRNAVTPHCQLVRNTKRTGNQPIGIFVENKGPGVAIIKRWRFVFHKDTEEEKDVSPEVAAQVLSLKSFTSHSELDAGKTLSAGDSLPVIWDSRALSVIKVTAEDEMISSRLCQLNIFLTYGCVNGSTKTISILADAKPLITASNRRFPVLDSVS